MTAASDQLVKRLQAEKEKTMAFFAELSDGDWQQTLYADGEHWTVRQVFAHLNDAEEAILRMMQDIQRGGGGAPVDFDVDRYNEHKVRESAALTTNELSARFSTLRDATIAWVQTLTAEELALEGRHPYLEIAPLESMIKLLYRHTQLHQRDIRKFLLGD